MKIHRLEAHDRYLQLLSQQSEVVNRGCNDCLSKNPLSLAYQVRSPYVYIFGHPRTDDDGVTKRFLWQPRLSKPKAQTNSYLFRAKSHTDIMEICWMIPPRELWSQYKKKNITESSIVLWSIHQFQHNRKELEDPFPEDFSDDKCKLILLNIAREMEEEIRIKKLYSIQHSSEEFLVSSEKDN